MSRSVKTRDVTLCLRWEGMALLSKGRGWCPTIFGLYISFSLISGLWNYIGFHVCCLVFYSCSMACLDVVSCLHRCDGEVVGHQSSLGGRGQTPLGNNDRCSAYTPITSEKGAMKLYNGES